LCQDFGVPNIDTQLRLLQDTLEEDELKLRDRLDQAILRDLNDPQDVYNAVVSRINSTRAKDYFLSMLQHLLLIREEGSPMVHYYQLIDSIVTDVVLDKKLAGAEQRLGTSVERIIAQFNESERYQRVEEELAKFRSEALQLRVEKESLEEELAQGQEGLVGSLKDRVAHLEQKLQVSREMTTRLQGQLETQKVGYEERIAQLETQILELFRMLKESGKGMEHVLEDSGGMDRPTVVAALEKYLQRTKTRNILEGRDGLWSPNGTHQVSDSEESDRDATPRKAPRRYSSKKSKKQKKTETSERMSQFMDADDAHAEEQVQQQIAASAQVVSDVQVSSL
jgi:cytokinesis protein